MSVKSLIFSLLTLCICTLGAKGTDIRDNVQFLAGVQTEGRSTGSPGNQKAAFYIINSFRGYKLSTLSYCNCPVQSFIVRNKGFIGHNIIGMVDANPYDHPDKYIVVGAHFDGLGTLLGKTYPCADANASGVAVMLQLAKDFATLVKEGRRLKYNIIFVAFDGYHEDISGAKAFMQGLRDGDFYDPISYEPISRSQIKMMVDLNQLGGSEAPDKNSKNNFLIVLGQESVPEDKIDLFGPANCMAGGGLNLYDRYGSRRFTESFYNMGDRKLFINASIPSLLFTSGITNITYSTDDTPQSLDYQQLEKRYIFIFNFLFLYLHGI